MARVRITQIKSLIGYSHKRQKRTMSALGFGNHGKINRSIEHQLTPAIQGMINRISHLVVIEKL
jgi:large subunit ribosomal protein L30